MSFANCINTISATYILYPVYLQHNSVISMFRYFGSKASSAKFVADIALDGVGPTTVADAFGGLGNIGAEFKQRGCHVTTCDLLTFPNAFQHARIGCQEVPQFVRVREELGIGSTAELLDVLNKAERPSHWFVREYSQLRPFFTPENGRHVGAAWANIVRWNRRGWLSDTERKYAVASLLNCADACANTAGTYYAYLKSWHRKALKPFRMEWLASVPGSIPGIALKGDALECLANKSFGVLYLDPPYNSRDYSRYYHLPETLAKLRAVSIDKTSTAGQPVRRSTEGQAIREAMREPYIANLIKSVKWKRLIVEYADGAHIPTMKLQRALSEFGTVMVHVAPALGYRTTSGIRGQKHHVFVVDC